MKKNHESKIGRLRAELLELLAEHQHVASTPDLGSLSVLRAGAARHYLQGKKNASPAA